MVLLGERKLSITVRRHPAACCPGHCRGDLTQNDTQFPTAADLGSWVMLSQCTIQSGPRTRSGRAARATPIWRAPSWRSPARPFLVWHLLAKPNAWLVDLSVDFADMSDTKDSKIRHRIRKVERLVMTSTSPRPPEPTFPQTLESSEDPGPGPALPPLCTTQVDHFQSALPAPAMLFQTATERSL